MIFQKKKEGKEGKRGHKQRRPSADITKLSKSVPKFFPKFFTLPHPTKQGEDSRPAPASALQLPLAETSAANSVLTSARPSD
jgi:hypothetical protein